MISSDMSDESVSLTDDTDSKSPSQKHKKVRSRQPLKKMKYDEPHYLGPNRSRLPTSTSYWTIKNLDSLHIYYDHRCHESHLSIVDMILNKTGLFGPLSSRDKDYLELVKNNLNFSSSVKAMLNGMKFYENLCSQDFVAKMENDIRNIRSLKNTRDTLEEDFITKIQTVMSYQGGYFSQRGVRKTQGVVPAACFEDIFRAFTRLCHLQTVPGEAWIGKMHIENRMKVDVSSEADLILFPESYPDTLLDDSVHGESISVVSVVELENLKSLAAGVEEKEKTRPPKSQSSSDESFDKTSEVSVFPQPEIFQKINEDVLGQHGGELLLHFEYYRDELCGGVNMKYMPGMIVVGTEVTFTLLEISADHMIQLKSKTELDPECKATIFYSQPKDMLKKEDRDILLDAFVRLNNVQHGFV